MSIGWSEFFEKPPNVLLMVCASTGAGPSQQSAIATTASSASRKFRLEVVLIVVRLP
jgi:hypothetical protein